MARGCWESIDLKATHIGKGELSTGGQLPQKAESGEIFFPESVGGRCE